MPIEIAALATTVVTSFLLPYVKEGATLIAEKVTKEVGESAADFVSELTKKAWARVKSVFTADEEKILKDFEENPDETKDYLTLQLKKKLEADDDLRKDLEKMVEAESPDGSGNGVQIMANTVGYVDARHAKISGGILAGHIGQVDQSGSQSSGQPGEEEEET